VKTLENHHGGNWLDRMLNAWPLAIDADAVKPILEVEYGANPLSAAAPDWRRLSVRAGRRCQTRSLFRNGVVYWRLLWPFGYFLHVRWCGGCRRAFLQAGFGWKLNGRLALLFRVQSDASAAAGTTGQNHGQATGWLEGDH
jgi:hypothetical protein